MGPLKPVPLMILMRRRGGPPGGPPGLLLRPTRNRTSPSMWVAHQCATPRGHAIWGTPQAPTTRDGHASIGDREGDVASPTTSIA